MPCASKKDSSIVVGCRLVKEGAAQGFFSAGSTGACLAAGDARHGPRASGVSRPALATVIPSPGASRWCITRHRRERRLQARVPGAVRTDGHRVHGKAW